jgi:hypothetical protein
VHSSSDVRQIEIYTAELLVLEPSPFEVQIAIVKLKMYKADSGWRSEIYKLINYVWNKEEVPDP